MVTNYGNGMATSHLQTVALGLKAATMGGGVSSPSQVSLQSRTDTMAAGGYFEYVCARQFP